MTRQRAQTRGYTPATDSPMAGLGWTYNPPGEPPPTPARVRVRTNEQRAALLAEQKESAGQWTWKEWVSWWLV